MADSKVKHQDLASALMRMVYADDVVGAKGLLVGIDEQDKKMIAAKAQKDYAPLCIATELGSKDMVEFLVKDCHANIEEGGNNYHWFNTFHSLTPLWYAACNGRLDMVKLLQELGADLNAVSHTETTSVNNACSKGELEIVKFLVRQGADIHIPDKRGRTCLMNSVHCLELCRFLINNGAVVDAQDNLGNTALHHAIMEGDLETVQLLLDHGSDQNIKNKQGDDALQLASLRGKELIVMELKTRQKPTALRWIESLQLLGSHCLVSKEADNVEKALVFWKRSVELRMTNPCARLNKSESIPACMIVKEVNTVEDLEELCRDKEIVHFVHMYALNNLLRILGPSHSETTHRFISVSNILARHREYRRSFNLLKHAFQLLQKSTPTWTGEYFLVLEMLHRKCLDASRESNFQIEFRDVFEIVDMVTSKAQAVKKMKLSSMKLVLKFVHLVLKLDKNPDEISSSKQVVRRLVHSQISDDRDGRTFLHLAVQHCYSYTGVVEVLLECGADANSFDVRNNTPFHLLGATTAYACFPFDHDERSKVIEILLQYSAHPDIVNDHGDFAATGLPLIMLDHVNLKCLATAVIRDHQIPYVGQIPESLESFVQMHGRCPSRTF